MKIERKEGLKKIKIEHNKPLFWAIVVLMIVLIIVIVYIVRLNKENNIHNPINNSQCRTDADCIPAGCCHPTSCTTKENVKPCNLLCSQDCSGPLDCGAGRCGCVKGNCQIVATNQK
jgi:hypothetical protein